MPPCPQGRNHQEPTRMRFSRRLSAVSTAASGCDRHGRWVVPALCLADPCPPANQTAASMASWGSNSQTLRSSSSLSSLVPSSLISLPFSSSLPSAHASLLRPIDAGSHTRSFIAFLSFLFHIPSSLHCPHAVLYLPPFTFQKKGLVHQTRNTAFHPAGLPWPTLLPASYNANRFEPSSGETR